jgi:hypothetical protein
MSDVADELPNHNPEGHELEPEQGVPIDAESLARHYEQDDVNVRGIVRFGIVIAVAAVAAGTVLAIVLRWWTNGPLSVQIQVPPALVTPPAVPGPGLDAAPETNLGSYLAKEHKRLDTYGWVDREAGIVHIPIEDAMRRLVQQGVPAREGQAPVFGLEPSIKLDGSGGLEPAGEAVIDTSTGDSGGTASGEGEDGNEAQDTPEGEDATNSDPGTSESGSNVQGDEDSNDDDSGEEPGGAQSGG